ncbi:hypothetical protein ACTWP4_18120 [Gracilibacillus sp. D59]
MYEKVGNCSECDKTVYCNDGFLDGVHEEGKVFCWQCAENRGDKKVRE